MTADLAKKGGYHHGALREALVEAAHRVISAKGRDNFTLADACRLAGVSTAAPYRHFADRDALIEAVCLRGYDLFADRLTRARDRHPKGSIEAIVAMGRAYVAFVTEDRELFDLMCGRELPEAVAQVVDSRPGAFVALLEAVDAYRERRGLADVETLEIAVPLWAFVHGMAGLMLSGVLRRKLPGLDVDAMIEETTRTFLAGFGRP